MPDLETAPAFKTAIPFKVRAKPRTRCFIRYKRTFGVCREAHGKMGRTNAVLTSVAELAICGPRCVTQVPALTQGIRRFELHRLHWQKHFTGRSLSLLRQRLRRTAWCTWKSLRRVRVRRGPPRPEKNITAFYSRIKKRTTPSSPGDPCVPIPLPRRGTNALQRASRSSCIHSRSLMSLKNLASISLAAPAERALAADHHSFVLARVNATLMRRPTERKITSFYSRIEKRKGGEAETDWTSIGPGLVVVKMGARQK